MTVADLIEKLSKLDQRLEIGNIVQASRDNPRYFSEFKTVKVVHADNLYDMKSSVMNTYIDKTIVTLE